MTDRRRHFPLRRLALGLAFAAFAAPAAAMPNETSSPAQPISPPPKVGEPMHWFHSPLSARRLQSRAAAFGSVAMLGLESMRDLASLRDEYGFDRVHAIPELHAAEVSVDSTQLRSLLAHAPGDRRLRYVSPVGPSRSTLGPPNDPLLWTPDPVLGIPYEWQFGVAGLDRALELSPGSPAIVVGTIDSGVARVPDLAARSMGAGRSSTGWNRWRAISTTAPATALRWRR